MDNMPSLTSACRTQVDIAAMHEEYKRPMLFSLPTRTGNWVNAAAIEEAKMAVIAYKKAHCQLLSSRTRAMLRNVLEPVSLSPCTNGVEYDKIYQIFSPSIASNVNEKYPYKARGLYLSGMLSEVDLDRGLNLMHGCVLSGSSESMPCRRNTFMFVSDTKNSNCIYYGDDLFIKINASSPQPLYLQAEGNTMDTFGDCLVLRLSQTRDVYCHFKILHAHPRHRKDTIGMTIMPNNNVIIQHVASGRNLAAEARKWITTFFGVECMAACHTYKNSNRIETAENMWQIVGHSDADKFSPSMLTLAPKD